jgi:molecular chaperone DnaK (HSP70)
VNAAGHRLGIDLGTSNTVATLAEPGGRMRTLLFDGTPLLPSAVFADIGGLLLVGADAVRAAVGAPAGLEANPKRRVDEGSVWLGEQEYPVIELLAAVLRRVAAEAARVAGGPVADIVLTHPAAWQRTRLGVLAAAAGRAGFGEVRFIPEPVAAAAYFATVLGHRVRTDSAIVVYDLVTRPRADRPQPGQGPVTAIRPR